MNEKPSDNEENECPTLDIKECFYFPPDFDCIRLMVEWVSKQQGIICDLDLNLYCYDERVRLMILKEICLHILVNLGPFY